MWRLQPPGNPTLWRAQNMFSMDDWIRLPEADLVLDHQPFAQSWTARSDVSDHAGQTGGLPIPHTSPVGSAPARLAGSTKNAKRAISIEQALAPRMSMPDFSTLIEQICKPCDYGKFPFQVLEKSLPAEVRESYVSLCRTAQTPFMMPWRFTPMVLTRPISSNMLAGALFSQSGEGTAIIRGLEWAIRESLTVPHAFCFDAQTVGFGDGGTYGLDRSDAFMIAARSLAKAAEAVLGRQLEWRYVKAHAGQVGNELADALAKHAVLATPTEPDFPEYIAFLGGDRFPIEQLWIVLQTDDESHVLPPVPGNQVILTSLEQAKGVAGRIMPSLLADQDAKEATNEVFKQKWNLLTYNVSSLQPRKSAFYVTYLRQQIAKAGYEVSFLQETRCRESQMLTSQSHYRLTSAAEAGRGGVEIWSLREKEPDCRTGFRKELIQVLHAEPQVLIAKATCKGVEYLFFTFHAPHSGAPDEVHQKFWMNLQNELVHWTQRFPNFVGGFDANAHVSFETEPRIGTHGLEARTNLAGTYLQSLLVNIGGWLPSTYECCHSGDTSTWISNVNGQGARCD